MSTPSVFVASTRDLVGQGLTEPTHVVQREAFADAGPPAAGTETDHVALFSPLWPKLPLLQNKGCALQIFRGVDALQLVWVQGMIAFDCLFIGSKEGDNIGQSMICIIGQRCFLKRGPKDACLGHIGADIQFGFAQAPNSYAAAFRRAILLACAWRSALPSRISGSGISARFDIADSTSPDSIWLDSTMSMMHLCSLRMILP